MIGNGSKKNWPPTLDDVIPFFNVILDPCLHSGVPWDPLGLFEIGYFQHLVNQDVLFSWSSSPLGAQVFPPMSQHFLSRFQPGWTMAWTSFRPRKKIHKILPRRFLLAKPADIEAPFLGRIASVASVFSKRASKALHCGGHVSPQRLGFVPGVPWICCAGDANNCII